MNAAALIEKALKESWLEGFRAGSQAGTEAVVESIVQAAKNDNIKSIPIEFVVALLEVLSGQNPADG